MVCPLRPARFYGKSLPRPQYYTDMKYSENRVDPPVSVLDPLLSWANDAHWSMGGLNFNRIRHQGRIEGNIKKLRAEGEKKLKNIKKNGLIQVKIEKARAEEEKKARKNGGIAGKIDMLRREEEEEEEVEEEEEISLMTKKMMMVKKKINRKGKQDESVPESVSPVVRTRSRRGRFVHGDQDESVPVSVTTESVSLAGSTRSKRQRLVLGDQNESVPVSATTASGSPSGGTRLKRRKLVLRDEDEETELN